MGRLITAGGVHGVSRHDQLAPDSLTAPDAHPIDSISGLRGELDRIAGLVSTGVSFKGSVAEMSDLPDAGSTEPPAGGDMWWVNDHGAFAIWSDDDGDWVLAGSGIDLSGLATTSALQQVADALLSLADRVTALENKQAGWNKAATDASAALDALDGHTIRTVDEIDPVLVPKRLYLEATSPVPEPDGP
ncbi:MAG: hypothetical protein FWD59_06720 [Micrococcales bacterium]|nr:hypothetical protein [Micrococcales bacterium]